MNTARHARPRPAAPGAMRRVLLVDGNVHVLHAMKSSLDRHGYEVDTALATDFARALYRESRHDVVIVDGDAHGSGGEALAASLVGGEGPGAPDGADAPLVIVIGGRGVERGEGGSGEDDPAPERWSKPVSLRYLVARLSEHFGHYDLSLGAPG